MARILLLQIHHNGEWHDAADLEFHQPESGIRGRTAVTYNAEYFAEWGAIGLADNAPVRDWRALSVRAPIDLQRRSADTWPAFLLDLLPQGNARRRICQELGFREDDSAAELDLLLRSAGSPIGNFRIKEARDAEQERVSGVPSPPGITLDEILARTDTFLDIAERFALVASGSSGVQGEWPKILMTETRSGLWYPDSLVDDADAANHVIVKFVRGREVEEALILEAERGYLEVARAFGIRVKKPLRWGDNVLVIPRFDRQSGPAPVVTRRGQESFVSAIGKAEFGYFGTHEQYLKMLRRFSAFPAADTIDYVLRDVLNAAMGNPDNHGRNTALQKGEDGTVRLAPLYDFAPMRLDRRAIARTTSWQCMQGRGLNPDWRLIAAAAADGDANVEDEIVTKLRGSISFLQDLPEAARASRVPEEAIRRAINPAPIVAQLGRL